MRANVPITMSYSNGDEVWKNRRLASRARGVHNTANGDWARLDAGTELGVGGCGCAPKGQKWDTRARPHIRSAA